MREQGKPHDLKQWYKNKVKNIEVKIKFYLENS